MSETKSHLPRVGETEAFLRSLVVLVPKFIGQLLLAAALGVALGFLGYALTGCSGSGTDARASRPPAIDWVGRGVMTSATPGAHEALALAAAADAGPPVYTFSGATSLRPDDAGGWAGSFNGAVFLPVAAVDGGPADTGPADTGPKPDAGPADGGPADVGPVDSGGGGGGDAGALPGLFEPALSASAAPGGTPIGTSALALPASGTRVLDPDFKSTLRRLVPGYVDVYSQSAPCTFDGMYCLLVKPNVGFSVVRYADLAIMMGPNGLNTPKWVPNTHKLIHTDNIPARVYVYDVDKATDTLVATLTGYAQISSNESYEDLDDAAARVAFFLVDGTGKRWFTVLDANTWAIVNTFNLEALFGPPGSCIKDPQWGILGPDWTAVSPDGDLLVVQWTRDGKGVRCAGTEIYSATTGAFLRQITDGHQHGDLGRDATGKQTYASFWIAYPPNTNWGGLVVAALDGSYTHPQRQLQWGCMGHMSCRHQRGRCLVSAGKASEYSGPFGAELYFVNFDGTAQRVAHHRSLESDAYWTEPKGSLMWNGHGFIFSTDFGTTGGYESFALEFTPLAAQPVPRGKKARPLPRPRHVAMHKTEHLAPMKIRHHGHMEVRSKTAH